jgi:hypothetical protein
MSGLSDDEVSWVRAQRAGAAPAKPQPPLSDDEIQWVRLAKERWERASWLGRLAMKIALWVGGTVTAFAAFKDSLGKLLTGIVK